MRPTWTGTYGPRRWARPARVDVHAPGTTGSHPAVVVLHGGAFVLGSRRELAVRSLARLLVDAGFVVVAPDYRTLTTGGRFAESVDDARSALAWTLSHASEHGIDPERISVVGISAGAAVAAVAADPWRLALFYGPYDFARLPLGSLGAWALLDDTRPSQRAWRSPANGCLTRAPVLLVHGDADRLVPFAHAEALADVRRSRGLPVAVHRVEGAGHAFLDHPGLSLWDDAAGALLSFLVEPWDEP